ncbi:MAG: hypothetical protein V4719_31515 [Planctomycetota bacterium]
MQRRVLRIAFAAILLAGLSGCVQETVTGTNHIYTYELWVPLSTLLAGIVAIPAGWFLREKSSRFGWGLLIFGPIAAIFFAPSLFRERATVDDSGFTLRSGIWGMTAVHEVKFAELQKVRITSEETRGRRGAKRTNYYFLCECRNGTSAKVPMNNEVVKAAGPYFVTKLAELKIPIVDET